MIAEFLCKNRKESDSVLLSDSLPFHLPLKIKQPINFNSEDISSHLESLSVDFNDVLLTNIISEKKISWIMKEEGLVVINTARRKKRKSSKGLPKFPNHLQQRHNHFCLHILNLKLLMKFPMFCRSIQYLLQFFPKHFQAYRHLII